MSSADPADQRSAGLWTWLAFLLALVMLAGSLFLTLGLGLKACPLCYYQRTFVMGAVGVLAIGLLSGAQRRTNLALLALPVAAGGLGVALQHVLLEQQGRMECPAGILGLGTGPQQSLLGFILLEVVLLVAAFKDTPAAGASLAAKCARVIGSVGLGIVLAVAAIHSVSPIPPPPPEAYERPPDICRPIRK